MSKSPFRTAIAVCSSMIGSSLLVVPINFMNTGIIQNTIASILMSVIMGSTAVSLATLVSGKYTQFANAVNHEMGRKWLNFLILIGGILTTLVGSIFFLLTSQVLFDILEEISPSVKNLGKHYFCLILLVFFLLISQLNSLKLVVKYSYIGLTMIMIYLITIFVSFGENVPNIDSRAFQGKDFNIKNVQFWLAVQGFSFLCHPTLDAVVKENNDRSKNGYAVTVGYIMTWVINVLVGILGALALYGKHPKDNSSVVSYFEGKWQSYVFSSCLTVYLISIYPIFPFVTRQQILTALPEKYKLNLQKTNLYLKIGFTLCFAILNIAFIFKDSSPSAVMGFTGAVTCYFIAYFFPTLLKIRLHNKNKEKPLVVSLITESGDDENGQKRVDPLPVGKYEKWKLFWYWGLFSFGTILMIGEMVFLIKNLIE